MSATQRNCYPETGCNGAPSLSIKTDFHVNFTETFSDVTRVFSNGNRRALPYGVARMIINRLNRRQGHVISSSSPNSNNVRQETLLNCIDIWLLLPLREMRV